MTGHGLPAERRRSGESFHSAVGIAVLLLVVLFGLPALGHAACPPLGPTPPSLLETLARHRPPPGTPPDANLVDLLKRGIVPVPSLIVGPVRGPAPLSAEVAWMTLHPAGPPRVELDLEGGGRFERVPEPLEATAQPIYGGGARHVYTRPGEYEIGLRVIDPSGRVTMARSRISVLSQAAFDAEFRAVWRDLKAALRAREVATALECVHSEGRAEYRPIFQAILQGTTPVDDILTDISFVFVRETIAEYEMLRTDERGRLSYPVHFELDVDGRWRLSSL
jgi:hypothetical protein